MTDTHSYRIVKLAGDVSVCLSITGNILILSSNQLYHLNEMISEMERLEKTRVGLKAAP